MPGYVLSIDCGTQSARAIIFDEKGNLLLKSQQKFEPYYSKKPGWAEQDPNLFWDKIVIAIKAIKKEDSSIIDNIDAIVVTTQRDTCVFVDQDGIPVRPAIIWADERAILKPRKMALHNRLALKAVRMTKTAAILSTHCMAHWVEDYQPEIWAKTYKYIQLSGYINFKLTGVFVDSVANQVGHIPIDHKNRRWEKPGSMKGQLFQIDSNKLSQLIETTERIGLLTKEAAAVTGLKEGIPVIAGGSDKGCETLGVGCDNNQTISLSLGSQATVQTAATKYYEVESFIPPFLGVDPAKYNPEVTIYRGYWMISWFKKEFAKKEVEEAERLGIAAEELLEKELSEVNPGADGLILQPYWGAGLKTPEAKGSIIGFSDYHTRGHIYRAIIEGISFALLEGMKRIEKKSGEMIEKVMISGGGSKSDAICQITADVFNLPVYRVQTYETSALGAAVVGYVANGTYQSFGEAVHNMVHEKDCFMPDQKNVKMYGGYEGVYGSIYKKLKPLYRKIIKIISEEN
jgi:sugar (pentulose or hexulose) kinase